MNRKDVIRMARQAGVYTAHTELTLMTGLERFAALVAAHEREECAKVCDDWPNGRDDVYSIGVAIRARKEK